MTSDLADGEEREVQGSGSSRYRIKRQADVYSCTCPAWRNQSIAIEQRTCKHIRRLRGDDAETARVGAPTGGSPRAVRAAATADGTDEAKAPPLLLAHRWDSVEDLTGWWMSEKLDGIRAYWDGEAFWSRLGNRFYPPAWFVAGLPATPLDGELWGGRKKFQRTTSIVRQRGGDATWKEIEYVLFDAPAHGGPFEDRIEACRDVVARAGVAHMRALDNVLCDGIAHLQAELARVEALGGEGLMLRRPGSRYEVGRSSSLLKVKTFHDAEARVVEHIAGAGRHKGRLGALQVELADGTRFSVGTGFSDREREQPPPIGAIITFRYQELSDAGVPRFPSFVGERIDASLAPPPAANKPPAAAKPKPKPAPAPARTPSAVAGGERRFELVDGKSSKFWSVSIAGDEVTTRWGKIGTDGQSRTKSFGSDPAARREYDKLIIEKTGKGYEEVGE